tara:strand:- start:938 stop:1165 length:228 start_codon:yes stop_codon:yes gene_type:complete
MTENKEQKSFDWAQFLNKVALLLCSLSLVIIALSSLPIAKWANYQNTCVEQEGKKSPIEWAVRKCNGRSKVYQVK